MSIALPSDLQAEIQELSTGAAYILPSRSPKRMSMRRAMMMEVFVFTKRPEILEKVKQMREDLFKNEEESSDEENEFICEDNQEFKESECKCALCNCLNTIKTKWIAWEPQNDFEIIFKNNIDKIPE